jgi:signal transduction histidine kinase
MPLSRHLSVGRVGIEPTTLGFVELLVQDDGAGFDPQDVRDGGLGLVGMRERVGLLGGRMVVESSEGAGTLLKAEVPIA